MPPRQSTVDISCLRGRGARVILFQREIGILFEIRDVVKAGLPEELKSREATWLHLAGSRLRGGKGRGTKESLLRIKRGGGDGYLQLKIIPVREEGKAERVRGLGGFLEIRYSRVKRPFRRTLTKRGTQQ